MWTYNPYRASLSRNGKTFALVTPDGRNALSEADRAILLDALNRKVARRKKPVAVARE